MGPMIPRAILRHGWMVMYRHFTRVETDAKLFYVETIYLHTLESIRDAALRKGRELAIAHTHNEWSASDPHTPTGYHAKLADELAPLVHITTDWKSRPSAQLAAEIRTAQAAPVSTGRGGG